MTYTIWTGTEAIEVQEDYNEWKNRQKGQLIGFNDLERGDVNVIDDVDKLDYDDIFFDAVTDVSNDEETVIFENGGEKDISDATIMFVDSDKGEGFTADEVSGIKNAIKDNNGDYLANAIYYTSGNDVLLVVFDTVDWMHNGIYEGKLPQGYVIYGEDAVTGNEKTIGYTGTLPTLTAGEATDAKIVITTANIDNGSTVDAEFRAANGTLAVASTTNVDRNGNSTITLSGTPATAGTAVLDVEVGGVTATFNITVNAAPSNIVMSAYLSGSDKASYKGSDSQEITVLASNAFAEKATVTAITKSGSDALVDFTTTESTPFDNNDGTSKTLTITPKATAQAGDYVATITIADGKANEQSTTVNFTVGKFDASSLEVSTTASANTITITGVNGLVTGDITAADITSITGKTATGANDPLTVRDVTISGDDLVITVWNTLQTGSVSVTFGNTNTNVELPSTAVTNTVTVS